MTVILLVSVLFILTPNSMTTFGEQTTPKYNPRTLSIYPIDLNYSTYLGGNEHDDGYGIAAGNNGSCYLTGMTRSSNFPTLNANDNTLSGTVDAFVSKFSANGSLLWSTYLGGDANDQGYDIIVANDGSCYVTGYTESNDFPTLNAYNSTYGGNQDGFISKFSTNGTLLWSTYFGGKESDYIQSIDVTADGSCYVTGYTWSTNFPTLNAYDNTIGGAIDTFVSKFNVNGALIWSTYLGGSDADWGLSLAVGNNDSCYVTGHTRSTNFPTLNGYNTTFGGGMSNGDAFITKLNTSGILLWSTYLGGINDDIGRSIAVASDGSCYVTGETESINFPIVNAYDSTYEGICEAYITKYNTSGSLLWSTFLGGNAADIGKDIAVTSDDNFYLTGTTSSSDYPTMNAHYNTLKGDFDSFITAFFSDGSLIWSTFLGGSGSDYGNKIAVGNDTSCFVTGETLSNDFPTRNAFDAYGDSGYYDIFLTKFSDDFTEPIISNVAHTPENPTKNDNILITCTANDLSSILSVTLFYRINGSSWETSAMLLYTSGTYQVLLVMALNVSNFIEYYIEAVDNSPAQNIAVNDNNTQFYTIVIRPISFSTSTSVPAYGFFLSIVVLPLLSMIFRKRKS